MTNSSNPPPQLIDELKQIVGSNRVSLDSNDLETYGRDWTRVYAPAPSAVVFPGTTEEVAALVRACAAHKVPIVPSGGRTGLSAGAVATNGEIVLSLDRLNFIEDPCPLARTLKAGAGAITAEVHAKAATVGLTWPVDFASAGSSQIGGNIATNAGGVRVVRYGLTRQWVLGLTVVTAEGEILELNGELEKNNTGFDLRQVFIGTEGTLGIITEVILKLDVQPEAFAVGFLAVEGIHEALSVFKHARQMPGLVIRAFEYLQRPCLEAVLKHRGAAEPFEATYGAYILVEVEGADESDARNRLEGWLERSFEDGVVLDGVVGQSSKDYENLWTLREGISESLTHEAFLYKYDVSMNIRDLGKFEDALSTRLHELSPELRVYLFGHIGDGNLHVNILKPDSMDKDTFLATCHRNDPQLFQLIKDFSGSVSAEHGIGLLKKSALPYSRSRVELQYFKKLKEIFDPNQVFNPGKILD